LDLAQIGTNTLLTPRSSAEAKSGKAIASRKKNDVWQVPSGSSGYLFYCLIWASIHIESGPSILEGLVCFSESVLLGAKPLYFAGHTRRK
jgi:hypothetical protein